VWLVAVTGLEWCHLQCPPSNVDQRRGSIGFVQFISLPLPLPADSPRSAREVQERAAGLLSSTAALLQSPSGECRGA